MRTVSIIHQYRCDGCGERRKVELIGLQPVMEPRPIAGWIQVPNDSEIAIPSAWFCGDKCYNDMIVSSDKE